MQRSDLVIFCVFGSLSSVIYGHVHLFSTSCGLKVLIKKGLIKKFIQGKISMEQLFILWIRLPTVRQTTPNNVSPSFYLSIRQSTYRVSQNCKIDKSFESVFSKLALLLRVWQRHFFTKSERKVKQRTSPFKKKVQRLKLKLYHFKI